MGGRRAILVALVVLLVCAPAALAEDPPFVDWNPLLPSVAPNYHPSRAKDCVDGNSSCVEHTLGEMYDRFDRQYASCDHNALFALTYIRVTEAIRKAIRRGFYEEPRYLATEDRVFARMYFAATDNWRSGHRELVPPAWRLALDAGRDRSVNGLGNLLMSMNAHVNRDMPFMMDALGLTKPDGSSRKPDHDRGNQVLNTLYDDVLNEMTARFDEAISNYQVPGTWIDDTTFFQILQGWREGVWRNAELLGRAKTQAERQQVANYIENYALEQGRFIKANTTIKSSAARDAHCRAYRRTHQEHGGRAVTVPAPLGKRATKRGVIRLRVRCDRGLRDCAGKLLVTRRGRRLAADHRIALQPGKSGVVRVRLRRPARKVLRRRHRLLVKVTARTVSPWGTTRAAFNRVMVRKRR
ncbi:MAG TPA: DUF5995 family protein [Thermoleophilaceae bacterium]|jgi:hypothetical protein